MSDDIVAPPKEPKRLSVQLERGFDRLRVVSARRQWGAAAFLLVWLSGWTLGCIVLLGVVIFQFSFFMLLFATPFWAAELFVFSLVGTMIASREEVVLDPSGLSYRWTVWRYAVTQRRIPLAEIVGVTGYFEPSTSDDGSNKAFVQAGQRITVHTIGSPQTLPGAAKDERRWLEHCLAETLATLKQLYAPGTRDSATQSPSIPLPADLPPILELRPPAAAAVSAPSDTTWSQYYDFDAITFTQRGRLALGTLGFLLFINAFWNGITGVFVAGLWGFIPEEGGKKFAQGGEWWTMFFFLIPFQLIGLAMFAGLVLVLVDPLRRSRWILRRNSVDYRVSYLGLGRTWPHEIRELDRLELRKQGAADEDDEKEDEKDSLDKHGTPVAIEPPKPAKASTLPVEAGFTLALVDRSGSDVCKIESLSLGEACWMADVVLRERAGWFAR